MIVWLDGSRKAEILERIRGQFRVRIEESGEETLVEASNIVGFQFETMEDGVNKVTVAISYRTPPERVTVTA